MRSGGLCELTVEGGGVGTCSMQMRVVGESALKLELFACRCMSTAGNGCRLLFLAQLTLLNSKNCFRVVLRQSHPSSVRAGAGYAEKLPARSENQVFGLVSIAFKLQSGLGLNQQVVNASLCF